MSPQQRAGVGQSTIPSAHLSPDDLAALIRAVELGSMSAVARERNVPVSQVSRAIDRLERRLATRLLRRSTRGLTLTPEGVSTVAHGREILGKLDELADSVSGSISRVSGTVRLSLSPLMAKVMVIPALSLLRYRHPALRLALHTDDRLVDLPTEGVDLALRTSIGPSESVVARQVGGFRRSILASPRYLKEYGVPKSLDDLVRHKILTHVSANSLNRWQFNVEGRETEIEVSGALSANSTLLIQQLALEGLGLASLSIAGAAEHLQSGALVEVLRDYRNPKPYPLYVVSLPDRQRSPRLSAVIDFLAEATKEFWLPLEERFA